MASAPDTSPYILTNPDGALANSRVLEAGTGLEKQDTGAGGTMTIAAAGNLATLATTTSPGYVICDTSGASPVFVQRDLIEGLGIIITNPLAQAGATSIAVSQRSTIQKVDVSQDGSLISTSANMNFTGSGGIDVNISDNVTRTDINIDGSGLGPIPPSDATYIIQTPDAGLPNAQALSALSTGLMKVTTTTGVVSTAVAGTDYQAASAILTSIAAVTPTDGVTLVGNGTGFDGITPGTAGYVWTSAGPGVTPAWEAAPGGGTGVIVTGTTQILADDTTYIANNNSSQITFTLPAVVDSHPGKYHEILGIGTGGWTLAQNATQSITVGNLVTTTGTGGSITSILPTDSLTLWCVSTTKFLCLLPAGQVTII